MRKAPMRAFVRACVHASVCVVLCCACLEPVRLAEDVREERGEGRPRRVPHTPSKNNKEGNAKGRKGGVRRGMTHFAHVRVRANERKEGCVCAPQALVHVARELHVTLRHDLLHKHTRARASAHCRTAALTEQMPQ